VCFFSVFRLSLLVLILFLFKQCKTSIKGPYWRSCMFELNIFNFIHVTLLTIISQRIKPYFSFPVILQNLLAFQNQIFK
ncbi:hypothetical protein LDENG_00178750, partial [Lucifuga dentata]